MPSTIPMLLQLLGRSLVACMHSSDSGLPLLRWPMKQSWLHVGQARHQHAQHGSLRTAGGCWHMLCDLWRCSLWASASLLSGLNLHWLNCLCTVP